jgi:signal transduction histidine kinase
MRRRLLLVLLAFAVVAVAGFAVPLLFSTAAGRTQQFVLSRTADVARFAALAQQADDPAQLEEEVAAHTALFGDGVVIVTARREIVVANGMRATEPAVAAAVDAALRNQRAAAPADLRPWSTGDVLFFQPVGTGVRVTGAVVLRSSVAPAAADITRQWAIVMFGAFAAAAACVFLVLRLARWVLRPVEQLADGVHGLAAGAERTHVDVVAGPPELRGLAREFNQMSDALAESAGRQRRLVADASHQLRNPLAALRLRIDSMAARVDDAGRPAYHSMVTELERLEALLDGMLALASADSRATDLAAGATDARCDAVAVLADRIAAWHDAAGAASVTITASPDGPAAAPVTCAESELSQVLDVVLDNAIKYAGTDATVRCTCAVSAGRVRIVLADDGPGVPPEDLHRLTERFWRSNRTKGESGSGLGLSIADRLVTASGGQFSVHSGPTGGLEVHIDLAEAR